MAEANSSLSTLHSSLLKKYWGYDDFRGIQREIIESIASGHDTLGLMPTGGGKSITFQIPALAQEGTCIVITPLIALMKDQVQNLRRRGIKAAAIYSGMSHNDILITLENAVFGQVKYYTCRPKDSAATSSAPNCDTCRSASSVWTKPTAFLSGGMTSGQAI